MTPQRYLQDSTTEKAPLLGWWSGTVASVCTYVCRGSQNEEFLALGYKRNEVVARRTWNNKCYTLSPRLGGLVARKKLRREGLRFANKY